MFTFEEKLAIIESFPELTRKDVSLKRVNFHYEESVQEKRQSFIICIRTAMVLFMQDFSLMIIQWMTREWLIFGTLPKKNCAISFAYRYNRYRQNRLMKKYGKMSTVIRWHSSMTQNWTFGIPLPVNCWTVHSQPIMALQTIWSRKGLKRGSDWWELVNCFHF